MSAKLGLPIISAENHLCCKKTRNSFAAFRPCLLPFRRTLIQVCVCAASSSGGNIKGAGPKGDRSRLLSSKPSNRPKPPPGPSSRDGGAAQSRGRLSGRQQQLDSGEDPPINLAIGAREVRLLGEDKQMIGVLSLNEALEMAEEADMDVVLLNGDAEPPLARLIRLSKYKYELAKADKEAKRRQRDARQDLKELKFRPNTDVHDYQVRLRNAKKFLNKGDKVKLTMQFRGREMEFQSVGREMFERFVTDIGEEALVAQAPSMQGYNMTLILGPNKK